MSKGKPTMITLPKMLKIRLKKKSKEMDTSQSEVMKIAFIQFLDRGEFQ